MTVSNYDNAGAHKRILAFLIDAFFASFLRVLLQLIFIPLSLQKEYRTALEKFTELFPQVTMKTVSSIHINYVLTTPIYTVFLRGMLLFTFTGMCYSLISYLFFNKTIGQKLLSLKVVNFKDSETKVAKIKYILKAILTPVPVIWLAHSIFYFMLYLLNFHLLIQTDRISIKIIAFFVKYANPFILMTVGVFFLLFWYGLYFITEKKILVDFLTMTRVIDIRKTKEYMMNNNSNSFVIEFGDKIIKKMEILNSYITNLNSKCFTRIKNIFTKKEKKDK